MNLTEWYGRTDADWQTCSLVKQDVAASLEVVQAMSDASLRPCPAYQNAVFDEQLNALTQSTDDHVIEDGAQRKVDAKEPPMTVMDVTETHNEKAERLNGRRLKLGVIAALGQQMHSLDKSFPVFGNGKEEREKNGYSQVSAD